MNEPQVETEGPVRVVESEIVPMADVETKQAASPADSRTTAVKTAIRFMFTPFPLKDFGTPLPEGRAHHATIFGPSMLEVN